MFFLLLKKPRQTNTRQQEYPGAMKMKEHSKISQLTAQPIHLKFHSVNFYALKFSLPFADKI